MELYCDPVIRENHYHSRVFKEKITYNKDPNLVKSPKPKHICKLKDIF